MSDTTRTIPAPHRDRGAFEPHTALSRKMDLSKATMPVAAVLAVAVTVGGWLWSASAAAERARATEAQVAEIKAHIAATAERQRNIDIVQDAAITDARLTVVEIRTKLAGIELGVAEIKTILRDRP
jgi:hypothetical protein